MFSVIISTQSVVAYPAGSQERGSKDKPSKEILALLFKMMDSDKTKRPTIRDAISELEDYKL